MLTGTSKKVVTRFAPSPTGYLHIGGIRTALYNYLFAKQNGGTFYVRIEDTDRKRFVADAEEFIKDSLQWFGLQPDAAPWMENGGASYRQSARDYKDYIKCLIDKGHAYYAFDTPEYIKNAEQRHMGDKGHTNFIYNSRFRGEMRNSLTMNVNEVRVMLEGPYVVRMKTPENLQFSITDIIRGEVSYDTNLMDDKILVKSDGIPTYHLANVCDDHDMGTTHVIRGEEWLPSAGHHKLLYDFFGWDIPQFAHLPLILNPNGKGKLSKRTGIKLGVPVFPMSAALIEDDGTVIGSDGFKDLGYSPEAVLNFLALLGWTPKDGQEILTIDDMIQKFKLEDVHLGGAKFDIAKANYFNGKWISSVLPTETLLGKVDIPGYYSEDKKFQILELAKARSVFFSDLHKVVTIFNNDVKPPVTEGNNAIVWTTETAILKDIYIKGLNIHHLDWKKEKIHDYIFRIIEDYKEKPKTIMPILRALVGKGIPGPDLMTTMEILGRNESLYRISNGLYL